MIILGIDCGIAITGFSVLEKRNNTSKGITVLDYGIITTEKTDHVPRRLQQLYDSLMNIIIRYKPDHAAVEELFYFKNAKTVITVAQARGVVLTCCQKQNVAVYEYTPLQVKQAVTGSGRAEKEQVQQMVKMLLGLKEIPKPDDAADALAIALKHSFVAPALANRLLAQNEVSMKWGHKRLRYD